MVRFGSALCVLLVGTGGAVAQVPSCNSIDYRARYDRFAFSIRYQGELTNATVGNATAMGMGFAQADSSYEGAFGCDPCEHVRVTPPSGSPPDSASAGGSVTVLTPIGDSASASCPGFIWCDESKGAYGLLSFTLGPIEGEWTQDMQSIPSGCKAEDCYLADCEFCTDSTSGSGREIGVSLGAYSLNTSIVPVDPEEPYGVDWSVSADFHGEAGSCTLIPFPECCERPPCGGRGAMTDVSAIYVLIQATASDAQSNEQFVSHAGLFVHDSSAQSHRLGFFADSAFDPGAGDVLFEATDFSFDFDFGFLATQVSMSAVTDSFRSFDGDLDQDEQVCGADRAVLAASRGSQIGDPAYMPRADFNLDGVIDADDFAIFATIPCNADADCIGGVNVQDFTAYLQMFSGANPAADIDGDGNLTTADFTAYLQAYAVGC